MEFVYYSPVIVGYLVFVYLSERLWPFSRPRGHVAERRYRRGRAFGLVAAALSLAAMTALMMPPMVATGMAGAALLLVVLALLRLRRSTNRPVSLTSVPSTGLPVSIDGPQDSLATEHQPIPGEGRQAALSFLSIHHPDISIHHPDIALDEVTGPKPASSVVSRPALPKEKLDALVASYGMDEAQRERFERANDLPQGAIADWREACERAIDESRRARKERAGVGRDHEQRIAQLQAELTRKDRALGEEAT